LQKAGAFFSKTTKAEPFAELARGTLRGTGENFWKWLAYGAIADVFTGGLISSTASIMAVSAVATYIPRCRAIASRGKV